MILKYDLSIMQNAVFWIYVKKKWWTKAEILERMLPLNG